VGRQRVIATVINDIHTDQRMQRICTTLAENGYDVILVGRKLSDQQHLNYPFTTKRWKCFFNAGILFYMEYNLRLFLFLLFVKYDIVHSVDADTIIPCVLISKIRNKKVIFDAHEWFSEVPELKDRNFKKRIWKWVENTFIPKTNGRITVSETLSIKFFELYKVNFEVVRNVPFLYQEKKEGVINEKYILYQGAINEGRGIELLCEASEKLPINVVIAGDGPLLFPLKKQYGMIENVRFLGQLNPNDLAKWTENAYLGYNLLENKGLSYFYSLSNKFFDYMKFGVPSLNSQFPEYQQIIESYDCGICIPYEVDVLIKNVILLLKNEEFYKKLKKNSELAHDFFNWDVESKVLIHLYQNI
jgi:glycosyltransferase involved in cell wall biosynthesis